MVARSATVQASPTLTQLLAGLAMLIFLLLNRRHVGGIRFDEPPSV
jgi:hypothetical protein